MLLERLTACTQDPEIMNAPLPNYLRPPSLEHDTTIMRPSGNDDFCLQVPNSSDYLIPLPDPRAIAERLLTQATGVTIPDTMTTYTMSTSHKMPETTCWETSFSKPITKPKLCSNDSMEVNNLDDLFIEFFAILYSLLKDRLISLDTPHQTPTTIDPPQSFCNSPIQNLPSNKQNAITLDPAALQQGYANVKMANGGNSDIMETDSSKYNGNNNNIPKDKNANQPFSIGSYGENHSEISC